MPPSLGYHRHDQNKESEFIASLDFILSHFGEPIWPRTISTHTTGGRQILAYNKEEAIEKYKQASLLDCRINAYPDYTEYKGINRQAPNFIFCDLDKSAFKSETELNAGLNKTLNNFDKILGSKSPTVLWSRNGYHICQPIEAFPLEQEEMFVSKSPEPSKEFLQFAERYLTNYKSDPSHHPSIKSCMVRIPASHNFKCVQKNSGIADSSTQVKIIQKWDGIRPKFNPLLNDFNIWLADKKLKQITIQQKFLKKKVIPDHLNRKGNSIPWIEKLLRTPIDDYRKNAIWRILAPYLINKRKLLYEEAFGIIKEWLNKCDSLQRLDSKFDSRIRDNLNSAMRIGYFPISLEDLKSENKHLYDIVTLKK